MKFNDKLENDIRRMALLEMITYSSSVEQSTALRRRLDYVWSKCVDFGFFVENAFSAPVRKLILILRPLWEKIRNAKLIITIVDNERKHSVIEIFFSKIRICRIVYLCITSSDSLDSSNSSSSSSVE
ncbi:hypothetical protein T07_12338 [Trichinella nelsoni]|uniref:Uncharacterized protein n=1 Tax=Trichinella nelsoni TaxID=6336 RepID=A0A0V0S940_9BILA|nr:hypothetical protein T07_12338 [Trichinella nelsoni]